jgi:AraC family transcriptional regulator
LAEIAVESGPVSVREITANARHRLARRKLGRADGWSVSEVLCRAGPRDRAFEEQHSNFIVAIIAEGSFQYRSRAGRELMIPGALLLGNPGQHFECSHEHGIGDRCISFSFEPAYMESLAAETGAQARQTRFSALRVPPLRELSSTVSRACAGAADPNATAWEEIAIELAMRAMESERNPAPARHNLPAAEARVTRIIRMIEAHPDEPHGLAALAREAKLSRYHFLRVFQLTGLTPHRYLVRARLRRAATILILEHGPVLEIALDSGFGDVSNFNHAFRAEFGFSPRSCRKQRH